MKYYYECDHPKHDALHPNNDNNHRFQCNTNHNDIHAAYFHRPPKNHLYTNRHLVQYILHFYMKARKLVHKHFAIHFQIDNQNHIRIYLFQHIRHLHMVHGNLECKDLALDDEQNHRYIHISRVQNIFHSDIHSRKSEHIRYLLNPNCSQDYLIFIDSLNLNLFFSSDFTDPLLKQYSQKQIFGAMHAPYVQPTQDGSHLKR